MIIRKFFPWIWHLSLTFSVIYFISDLYSPGILFNAKDYLWFCVKSKLKDDMNTLSAVCVAMSERSYLFPSHPPQGVPLNRGNHCEYFVVSPLRHLTGTYKNDLHVSVYEWMCIVVYNYIIYIWGQLGIFLHQAIYHEQCSMSVYSKPPCIYNSLFNPGLLMNILS